MTGQVLDHDSDKPSLNDRKKRILKAVINDYIKTAEPVGSKSLVKKYDLNVSSATVRNEMSELEELGYLVKPHTSAGRVPSDLGYRTYVDEMMEIPQLPAKDRDLIDDYFRRNLHELVELIKSSADILSEQTSFPTLVLSPRYSDTSLQQIKILMIEPGKALVVVVLSPGIVKDRLIRIPNEIDGASLNLVAGAIEEGLSGKRLDEITLVTVTTAVGHSKLPEALLNQVLYEAYVSIKQAEQVDVYMEGSHKLLKQPEFKDAGKAHKVMDMISQEGLLAGYLSEIQLPAVATGDNRPGRPKFTVRIGQEIALDGFEDCSFITSSYCLSDEIQGKIGILGPRRMAYSKIISQINFVNKKLTEAIHKLGTEQTELEDLDD